jgi:hypothetical protein
MVKFTLKYLANKSIEFYKKEYQKNLQDYNLYSTKRNDIYSLLYELLQKAYGTIPRLNGTQNHPTWNTNNKIKDVYDFFLFNSGIDGKERDFIISELDNKFSDKEFFI